MNKKNIKTFSASRPDKSCLSQRSIVKVTYSRLTDEYHFYLFTDKMSETYPHPPKKDMAYHLQNFYTKIN